MGLRSGNWEQSDSWKALDKCHRFFQRISRIYFSGWIDNRNSFFRGPELHCVRRLRGGRHLSAFLRGWAIFKPVEGVIVLYGSAAIKLTSTERHFLKTCFCIRNETHFFTNYFAERLQRCIFILFHSRCKRLEHWLQIGCAKTRMRLSQTASGTFSFCTVLETILINTQTGYRRKFVHPRVTR